jgi:cytochrome c-type biogenesis protein CcmH
MKRLTLIIAAVLMAGATWAVEPKEMLKDPALEARAREVGAQLACVVCQGETIDESGAEIAGDMRTLVRQRITAGDSNQQIIDYMVSRYGDYVRLQPRFIPRTFILWIGPFAIFVLGLFVVLRRLRRGGDETMPLTPEEQAALVSMRVGALNEEGKPT